MTSRTRYWHFTDHQGKMTKTAKTSSTQDEIFEITS